MATLLGATPRATTLCPHMTKRILLPPPQVRFRRWRIGASPDAPNSYLDMWKSAVDRGRKAIEFQKIADNTSAVEDLGKKSEEFEKILEVSKEERDRIQRMQVVDRAAAAIAAARAALKESPAKPETGLGESDGPDPKETFQGTQNGGIVTPQPEVPRNGTPGPDFWSWNPPKDGEPNSPTARASPPSRPPARPVAEKERTKEVLPIPFESTHNPPLPPLQSLIDVAATPSPHEELAHNVDFSVYAAEAARALDNVANRSLAFETQPDGSRQWTETGIEQRPDGVVCKWTLTRGVSADEAVEWQEKYWEAADELGYKELGSEKSGRDAAGSVWREHWRESMREDSGVVRLEKTADKWGKNDQGEEWQEEWSERYDSSGQADKWAHKWCSIDPATILDAGHAHVWHERWGEEYDGKGGSVKYTDKWAERCEEGGWTKWGDKWDENFNPNGEGEKQGETWWEGTRGERWNRTWGEGHNGSGWVHKYGQSSSGEHWDTHEAEETWYEKFPHFGFYHCYDHSVQLREVPNPSDMSL